MFEDNTVDLLKMYEILKSHFKFISYKIQVQHSISKIYPKVYTSFYQNGQNNVIRKIRYRIYIY